MNSRTRDTSLWPPSPIRRATGSFESRMKRCNGNVMRAAVAIFLATLLWAQTATAQEAKPFRGFQLLRYLRREASQGAIGQGRRRSPAASKALAAKHTKAATERTTAEAAAATAASGYKNVQVNQDRNPWPKAELGAAIDP